MDRSRTTIRVFVGIHLQVVAICKEVVEVLETVAIVGGEVHEKCLDQSQWVKPEPCHHQMQTVMLQLLFFSKDWRASQGMKQS